ncbi:hypothetical protein TEK04_01140 [Klenkia sp. LSe6-5]|uniref:Uncharacterized protein n=1 Tax=Klenkia sesuvii TaxID=3103137 RepID=A0ABU8DND2_9ACTN
MTDLPDGTYVEWRGRTYRGSDTGDQTTLLVFAETQEDPEFTPGRVRGWRRTVPAAEATLVELTTRCRWQGEVFWVVGRSDPPGRLQLSWTGRDESRAEQLGLTRVDKFGWETVVPEAEVDGLEQVRRTG